MFLGQLVFPGLEGDVVCLLPTTRIVLRSANSADSVDCCNEDKSQVAEAVQEESRPPRGQIGSPDIPEGSSGSIGKMPTF